MGTELKFADQKHIEKHYRVTELAELWGVARTTLRELVKNEPDVLKIKQGKKKTNTIYSIPESVARRIHTRLSA